MRRLQDQTHQLPIIIGAKKWESKRGDWELEEEDGWMDGGQKRRTGKAEGELKSGDGDCLQRNQEATALSFLSPHKLASSPVAAAPAPAPLSLSSATATVLTGLPPKRSNNFLVAVVGWWGGRRWEKGMSEGHGHPPPLPWMLYEVKMAVAAKPTTQVGPPHAQATTGNYKEKVFHEVCLYVTCVK